MADFTFLGYPVGRPIVRAFPYLRKLEADPNSFSACCAAALAALSSSAGSSSGAPGASTTGEAPHAVETSIYRRLEAATAIRPELLPVVYTGLYEIMAAAVRGRTPVKTIAQHLARLKLPRALAAHLARAVDNKCVRETGFSLCGREHVWGADRDLVVFVVSLSHVPGVTSGGVAVVNYVGVWS